MEKSNQLAVVILAAGTSSRLGFPKQLLTHKNETLLKITVKKALELSKNVFVILGHEKESCRIELKDFNVNIIYNSHYKNGIGSSISLGINHTKNFDNTMIMLCDQPFIPLSHFLTLKEQIKDDNIIIASSYGKNKNPKVPAIFPKKYYDELIKLNNDFGAKTILEKENCHCIELKKENTFDIDTIDDIKLLS